MIYRFNQYRLDTGQYQLRCSNELVALEPLAFALLTYLIEHRERVVPRDELLDQLWKGKVVTEAALSKVIKDARRAVGDSGEQQAVIKTLHGRGYQFIGEMIDTTPVQPLPGVSPALDLPELPSIAVLPFDNLSSDPEQDYFIDGVIEDIITALSHFSGLFVISRNSSFCYRGQAIDTRQVARDLGVRYLLKGSVRRAGQRIRISGQLINSLDGNNLWAEQFDGDLSDIFQLQDDITQKIVGSIAPRIELAEVDRGRGLNKANLSSYEMSLKAKSLTYDAFQSGDADQLQSAIATAEAALRLDARNTHALWILGFALFEQFTYQWGDDPANALDRSLQVAESLIQADSTHAGGYVLRAGINTYRREFDLARADYDHGLALNPNASLYLIHAAWGKSLAGSTGEARAHAELALRLSPKEFNLLLGIAYLALLQACFAEGDFEQARHWGQLSVQMHARAPIRRALMVACCTYLGKPAEAQKHAQALANFSPDFIDSLRRGDLVLYREPQHNALLIDGLRQSDLFDPDR